MTESVRVSAELAATPQRIYAAWLDSAEHSAMTGAPALVEPVVGGKHSAWGGYIEGTQIDLDPGRRIVQSWRASDFPPNSPESRVEVLLEPVRGGTEVTILHTLIPRGQAAYFEKGWREFYFEPMRRHFGAPERKPPTKKPPPAKSAPSAKGAPAAKAAKASVVAKNGKAHKPAAKPVKKKAAPAEKPARAAAARRPAAAKGKSRASAPGRAR